jgi:broad specificity phosphatase PhoE
MVEALDEIAGKYRGETVVVVAHGACIACFLFHVLGLDPMHFPPPIKVPNTSLTMLTKLDSYPQFASEPYWKLEMYGDVSHQEQWVKDLVNVKVVQAVVATTLAITLLGSVFLRRLR